MLKKTILLGFHMINQYLSPHKSWSETEYSFFCCGGLNSLTRKNIDKVLMAFSNLSHTRFKLYIYIQGVQIPPNISKYQSDKIIIEIGSKSYFEIAKLYQKHDIFIHLGDHEGLGLGFYESLSSAAPVLTLNIAPNNEIIKDSVSGWLIDCDYQPLTDNNEGLIQKGSVTVMAIQNKLQQIILEYDRNIMYVQTCKYFNTNYKLESYIENITHMLQMPKVSKNIQKDYFNCWLLQFGRRI